MKKIFEILLNLFLFIWYTFSNLLGFLWYGKLPKISLYHQTKYIINIARLFNEDDYHFVLSDKENIPRIVKYKIIDEYISALVKNPEFRSNVLPIDIPIFDGKEVIGSSSVMGLLVSAKREITTDK